MAGWRAWVGNVLELGPLGDMKKPPLAILPKAPGVRLIDVLGSPGAKRQAAVQAILTGRHIPAGMEFVAAGE
jgi:hypothetical protein